MQQGALIDDSELEPAKAFARELEDGQPVDSVFVVRDRARRENRNGESYLKLRLSDVSGTVEGVVWDDVDAFVDTTGPGTIVRVEGRFSIDSRYGGCITVRSVRAAAEHEYDAADLHDAPPRPYEAMVGDMRDLIATVQNRHLRALLESFFGAGSTEWERWRQAPAAKHYHQAYRHGLLEHCLSVAQGVSALSATFPGIDRDVAVTGALLHDIGKIEAYEQTGAAIEMSDAGKLQGEIPLGYYMVRRRIEDLPGFPADVAQAVLHIILSHHGKLEHGSPVAPCTREATLVHMIDNLGGTLGSFDRIEKSLAAGECWSAYDRGISSSAYFSPRRADAA
ncbi:MAG: 3-5 exoribonuclease [Thermoleophilales bacterium]|nr:3-5 exoribonuclease [Thermoleophilales bacterium]